MNANAAKRQDNSALDLVRLNVRDVLTQNKAFLALPSARQQEIARTMVEIGSYLVQPEGIRADTLPSDLSRQAREKAADPYALGLAQGNDPLKRRRNGGPDEGKFVAQAAREGVAAAGALLQAVNFPEFVSGLIKGVFHAIVQASIEQMEAYGKLVADVAKTLNQFRDENVSVNQGRDHLVEQFPDYFQIGIDTGEDGSTGPRVRLRDGIDEDAALKRINSLPVEGGPVSSLDDETIEEKLVPAARTQLATSRQQLLATMVLMGINRIVVTDGKISAKVLYDFKAQDNFKYQNSASYFDYGDQYAYTSEGERETEKQGPESSRTYQRDKEGAVNASGEARGASYYSKGTYKNTATPVLTVASATQENTDAALQTKATLAGTVEVNFKSDYFPLEKMADSFQIGQIQNAAQPGRARNASNAAQSTNAGQPTTPAVTPAPQQ